MGQQSRGTEKGGEVPPAGSPEGHGADFVGMSLGILGGDHGGGQSPVNVGGGTRTVLQLISAGDPLDLTGLQVRAHGEREAGHRIGSVDGQPTPLADQ